MAKPVITWTLKTMSILIKRMLQNKFDCFIVIEGNRGLGKSTLAIHLARRVARQFANEGSKDYGFSWFNSFIYSRKETKKYWHSWRKTGIGDEMINVTFNRDFYNEDQKDIIKMMNMNRDHCNFFIACVPQFQTLDSQIKNLCKIRITVVRRGVAVIQTPNRTIYIKDRWDQATNEKIERDWIKKGVTKPHYTKLSTFRGLLRFNALHPSAEKKYQATKDKKRNIVAQEEMGMTDGEEEKTPVAMAIELLEAGKIRNGIALDGIAMAHGEKPSTFKAKVTRNLRDQGKDNLLKNYYWENKERRKAIKDKQDEVEMLKNKLS